MNAPEARIAAVRRRADRAFVAAQGAEQEGCRGRRSDLGLGEQREREGEGGERRPAARSRPRGGGEAGEASRDGKKRRERIRKEKRSSVRGSDADRRGDRDRHAGGERGARTSGQPIQRAEKHRRGQRAHRLERAEATPEHADRRRVEPGRRGTVVEGDVAIQALPRRQPRGDLQLSRTVDEGMDPPVPGQPRRRRRGEGGDEEPLPPPARERLAGTGRSGGRGPWRPAHSIERMSVRMLLLRVIRTREPSGKRNHCVRVTSSW